MASSLLGWAFCIILLSVAACSRSAPAGPPAIALDNGTVTISGLPSATLAALETLPTSGWPDVLRVMVSADAPPMLGAYAVDDGVVRFTPAFPLDVGRQYSVRFDPAPLPASARASGVLTASIGTRALPESPTTIVTRVYPTSDEVPENVLRMYVEFSRPMGRKSGVEYISVLDNTGKVIPGAVLPLDYEFWSPDHRRFTVFFDPGRVKEGILPNREMGRAFRPGTSITVLISPEWRDERGLPLTHEFRRTFRVVPAMTRPLDPAQWRITPPPASTREPLVVAFGQSLDHSLLQRALGVRQGGAPIEGDTEIGPGETTWRFTPHRAWRSGTYQFLALDILEDVAGNQVGRAFEVDNFDSVDKDPDPQQVLRPFIVK